jgi:hypothetical protein
MADQGQFQSDQQVQALFAPSLLVRRRRGIRWTGPYPFLQHGHLAGSHVRSYYGWQAALACLAHLFHPLFDHRHEHLHLNCPPLLLDFPHKGQVVLQMHIAADASAWVLPIGAPSIMYTLPLEVLQNADGAERLYVSLGMHRVVRQRGGASSMHPMPFAIDIESGFILMQHHRLRKGSFDLLFHRMQLLSTALDQFLQGSPRHERPKQIMQHFTGQFIRHQLLLHQIDRHYSKRRTILHGSTRVFGKARQNQMETTRTTLAFGLTFDQRYPLGRQIAHPPSFQLHPLDHAQVVAAVVPLHNGMPDQLVRQLTQKQGSGSMTRLAPRLLSAFLGQALGLTPEPIRLRRQMAIVTVFRKMLLQLLWQPLKQLLLIEQHILELQQEVLSPDQVLVAHRSFLAVTGPVIICSKQDQFYFCRHAATVPILRLLCQLLGLLNNHVSLLNS